MTNKFNSVAQTIGGGFKAIDHAMPIALQLAARKICAGVSFRDALEAIAFVTGRQRGGLQNEHGNPSKICNKNTQAQLTDHRALILPHSIQHNSIAAHRPVIPGRSMLSYSKNRLTIIADT